MLSTARFILDHPLNRQKRLEAVLRFVKWQISSRLAPGAIAFDWLEGAKFLVRRGETGLTGNIYTGLHEFVDMAFLLHVLRKGDLFVDVGANVGSYTILACAARGARGIAFEPNPGTFARLIENLRLNNIMDTVAAFNIGLGNEDGVMEFTSDLDTMNHVVSVGEQCKNKSLVQVARLDSFLQEEAPNLMKIDVEGYETLVLKGGLRVLENKSLHSVIVEINGSGARYGFEESKIIELMMSFGFGTYSYDPISRNLLKSYEENSNSGNVLFIRDEHFVRDRLMTCPKIGVYGREL